MNGSQNTTAKYELHIDASAWIDGLSDLRREIAKLGLSNVENCRMEGCTVEPPAMSFEAGGGCVSFKLTSLTITQTGADTND